MHVLNNVCNPCFHDRFGDLFIRGWKVHLKSGFYSGYVIMNTEVTKILPDLTGSDKEDAVQASDCSN